MTAPQNAQLNRGLVAAFQEIRRLPRLASMHGDSCDRTIVTTIADAISARPLSADEFRGRLESQGGPDQREAWARKSFQFSSTFDRPFIVDKPHGSQQWPDALIVYWSRGLPIELKSSKGQKIVWNSGGGDRVQAKGIYVFHGVAPKHASIEQTHTTFFLGEDIIGEEEKAILKQADEANKHLAKDVNARLRDLDSSWDVYARPMFNCHELMLTAADRAGREARVLQYLDAFDWRTQQP